MDIYDIIYAISRFNIVPLIIIIGFIWFFKTKFPGKFKNNSLKDILNDINAAKTKGSSISRDKNRNRIIQLYGQVVRGIQRSR